MSKKPLSDREREALRIFREVFPDHDIYPNMRLADVIRADWRLFNFIKGFHLDFTICDNSGHTVAAIELDDSTHDTRKARVRDAKKDKYLLDAGIKLIRIRELFEIYNIPSMLGVNAPRNQSQPETRHQSSVDWIVWNVPGTSYPARSFAKPESQASHILFSAVAGVVFVGLFAWVLFSAFGGISNFASKKSTEIGQHMVQDIQRGSIEQIAAQKALAEERKRTETFRPQYVQSWVKGKSARECAGPSGVLDDDVIRCMNSHYEMVLVNGE